MKRIFIVARLRLAGLACAMAAALPLVAATGENIEWKLKLEGAESCSCAPACPCIFGSAPTHSHCNVNMWIHVKQGRYGSLRLDGLSLVMTGEMRKSRRYYFETGTAPEQVQAITNIFARLPVFTVEKVLSVEQVPLHFERNDSRISFSVPASTVEMETKKGRNGKPITIQNTGLGDYVQYVSITNSHRSDILNFAYSGTSGATWKFEAKGQLAR
jgi:hypothetical protein